jgi:hypothetical protein
MQMAFLHQILDPVTLSRLTPAQKDSLASKLEAEVAALSGGNAITKKALVSKLKPQLNKMLKSGPK